MIEIAKVWLCLLGAASLLFGYVPENVASVAEEVTEPGGHHIPWCAWLDDTACAMNGYDSTCYYVYPSETGICFCRNSRLECY